MDNHLHLNVTNAVNGNRSRRTTTLRENDKVTLEIFHEFDSIIPFTPDTLLDGHVLSVLLTVMQKGKPLVVHGALSQGFMRNLHEMQLAWRVLKPEWLTKVDILPDRIIDARRGAGADKAIAAFSGGVDASFTALSHAAQLPQKLRYPLTDVLMVHGFDVKLDNTSEFEQLLERVRPFIAELNLSLRTIRTDSKEKQLTTVGSASSWEYSFGLELAACLHMYSQEFQFGLVGSSEPYNALVLPWGSSPATDYLMSGDQFTIVHDGAGYCRTAKIAQIAHHPILRKTLKVCWSGADQSANCGACEKCVRTQMNFLAVGSTIPECFPAGFDPGVISSIRIMNAPQMVEMMSLSQFARSHQVKGVWLDELDKRIAKGLTKDGRRGAGKMAVQALNALGLKEPLKKALNRRG